KNNYIGTVGIAHNTTIMPVKAAMASGYLHDSDIAKAVLYAYENGAEVINMSFGGSSCSIAVQDALATAYTRCVLVASAGNNGESNELLPNYPAALTYVLGVMAVDKTGTETYFTNWDKRLYNGVEYELYAPGYDIMSTLPDDRYGALSGTSMAAPVVSAMAAILRSEFEDKETYPTKFIYGQLTSTSEHYATCFGGHGTHNLPQIANLHSALTKLPNPDVGVQDFSFFDTEGLAEDTAKKNNGDGVIDAGETIALGFTLKNRWGKSDNTLVTIDTKSNAGISDPYITIVNPTVNYGSVGSYSTQDCGKTYTDVLHTGWEKPFIIKIADNCPNDYIVKFNVRISCENGFDGSDNTVYTNDSESNSFLLTVRNGVILPATITEDLTLTPDNLYIIPNSTVIEKGATVRVLPGTNIQFWTNDPGDPYADTYIAYLAVKGSFIVEGTKEAPVKLYPSELMSGYNVDFSTRDGGYISLKYADVTNYLRRNTIESISYADRCVFRMNYGSAIGTRYVSSGKVTNGSTSTHSFEFGLIKNSVFYKLGGTNSIYGKYDRCVFADSSITARNASYDYYDIQNCVFLGNVFHDQTQPNVYIGSTVTATADTANKASDVHISYNKETGTTYVRAHNPINYQAIKRLGGSYMVINDEAEAEFAKANLNTALNDVGIYYDSYAEKFFWADGTPLNTAFDTKGVLTPQNGGSKIVLYADESLYYTVGSAYYHTYEIPGQIFPTDITFKDYAVDIDKSQTYQIEARSVPVQLGLTDFIYESQNEEVVKVSGTGLVTAVGNGTAAVRVYSKDRAVCNYITFNVLDYVPLKGLELKCGKTFIAVGEKVETWMSFEPANTSRKQVTITSSNPKVVAVDKDDNLVGIASGTAVITATCDGVSCSKTVRVFNKASVLELSVPAIIARLNDEAVDMPEVIASEGADTEIAWRVLDNAVAEISDGKLRFNTVGVTTLEVTDLNSGLKAECTVVVYGEDASNIKDYQYSS
ncbi:MAG: S8 family serine peptidase, partial [Clostridia bacterium]|nr:S8 family serine peptidase [Clostridia bacterium]